METAITVAMFTALFTALLGLGWRLERKMDKTAADLRGEMRSNHTELTNRLDKQADRIETVRTELTERIDKTEVRLRGEIRTVRTELTDTRTELTGRIETVRTELTERIDKTETRLSGEIREVENKVDLLEKRVGHYEQRISFAEGNLNMKFGASPPENPTARPIDD